MADSVKMTVHGDKQLVARMVKLRKTEKDKIIRKGLRSGSKIIKRETEAGAPVGPTGRFKKSFKVRAMKRRRGRIGIQVQSGEGFFKGETFYGGFVALGHRVGPRRLGDKRKQVPPNRFMQEAADRAAPEAIRVLEDEVRRGLDAFIPSKKK